mmetsp:Transcript_16325/g.26182  ORF Transcript_16325/g.26182 Transcript_16325/m.26182 type:complete len:104 (-) Transcript_16325:331-642(-)
MALGRESRMRLGEDDTHKRDAHMRENDMHKRRRHIIESDKDCGSAMCAIVSHTLTLERRAHCQEYESTMCAMFVLHTLMMHSTNFAHVVDSLTLALIVNGTYC